MTDDLLHGPLEDRHRELGAGFAEFGGWLMPVSYAGTVSEHNATRNAVGLFDVSHLGKALVRGPGAAEFVNSALTNDLRRIRPGKAQYTLCCTESGGVIDDLAEDADRTGAADVAVLLEERPELVDEHRLRQQQAGAAAGGAGERRRRHPAEPQARAEALDGIEHGLEHAAAAVAPEPECVELGVAVAEAEARARACRR